jgi:hypothetical protein
MRTCTLILALVVGSIGNVADQAFAQNRSGSAETNKVGVLVHDQKACEGYTLFSPLTSKDTT